MLEIVSKAVSAKVAAMLAWVSLQPRDLKGSEKDDPPDRLHIQRLKGARMASMMGLLTLRAMGTNPNTAMRS